MREFFGFGGYTRTAEGYMSWQHLTFVSLLLALTFSLAVLLGIRNRKKDMREKNKVLAVSAILIDSIEIIKIVLICIRSGNPLDWIYMLPLFLCSICLIAIPLAAFSKGVVKEASLDFVFIFGILAAVLGTYGAGNNYSVYPVLSLDNVASGITHAISGFAALYIAVSGMLSMRKKNMLFSYLIITLFCAMAYVADLLIPYNYMFLIRGDGTPYDIIYNLVGGNPVIYPVIVVALFIAYISVFYLVYFLITKKRKKQLPTGVKS